MPRRVDTPPLTVSCTCPERGPTIPSGAAGRAWAVALREGWTLVTDDRADATVLAELRARGVATLTTTPEPVPAGNGDG